MNFKTVDTSTLALKGRTGSGASKYMEIVNACKGLKPGQSLIVDLPADEPKGITGYRNKLSYKIRLVPTPAGTFLQARATADGKQVAVSLVTGAKPPRPKGFTKTPAQLAAAKAARDAKKQPVGAKK